MQKGLIFNPIVMTRVMGESISTSRYNFMCDECGMAFLSLEEYIEHYKRYHPTSIGTSLT